MAGFQENPALGLLGASAVDHQQMSRIWRTTRMFEERSIEFCVCVCACVCVRACV